MLDLNEDQYFARIKSRLSTMRRKLNWFILSRFDGDYYGGLVKTTILIGYNLIYLPCRGRLTGFMHTAWIRRRLLCDDRKFFHIIENQDSRWRYRFASHSLASRFQAVYWWNFKSSTPGGRAILSPGVLNLKKPCWQFFNESPQVPI